MYNELGGSDFRMCFFLNCFPIQDGDFRHSKWSLSNSKYCDFPIKHCDFLTQNGDLPIQSVDFPMKNGEVIPFAAPYLPLLLPRRSFAPRHGAGRPSTVPVTRCSTTTRSVQDTS